MAKDFTQGNPGKLILGFSIPLLIGNVFQQLYSTVDSIIVGNFEGKQALAAISGSFSVQFLILAIAFGFSAGMSIVIAQVYGAKDFVRLKKTFSTGLIFVFILSIVLGVIGYFITEPALKLLGTPDNILEQASIYLKIMFVGLPAMFVYNFYSAVLRAVGDSKTPLYFLIIASVINMVLDYVCVAYFKMGVAGVAYATLTAQLISGILSFIYVNNRVAIFKLGKNELVYDKEIGATIIKYGLPAAVQQSIISISFLAVQSFVNFFGEDMMAAFGVVNRIESFVTMPIMNIATALSMYAGQNIGAGDEERAKQGVNATYKIQFVFWIVMLAILPMTAEFLLSLFGLGDEPRVLEIGIKAIDFCVFFYIVFALFQTVNQFVRGVGDTTFSMFASLCMVFVRIPATYYMIHILNLGEMSVWYGMIIGWATAYVINAIRYYTGGWKGKAFVQGRADKN